MICSLLSIKYDTDHKEMSGTLLATYVLSGCDTVKYWQQKGCSDCLVPSIITEKARQYFVALYGHNGFESLDKLHEHIFVTTKSDLRVLPPTEDSFYHHVLPVCSV